jgi:pilus assembly protein Flp/PilA
MKEKFRQLIKDEEGATAVEYGIMIAAIAAIIVTVVIAIGEKIETGFNKVNDELEGLNSSTT